ncbi:hypothetical protein CHS0354_020825 [Potamilus streckersoni]|uniref:Uncharacterized protein n=1 Tax=Potamilus streckersoni TaxID=2493646 RepID=A0AAE0W7I1_9BIVA|nr:hypothetical protein CHS0354_020825 [Potamilus streckersoni]
METEVPGRRTHPYAPSGDCGVALGTNPGTGNQGFSEHEHPERLRSKQLSSVREISSLTKSTSSPSCFHAELSADRLSCSESGFGRLVCKSSKFSAPKSSYKSDHL